MNPTETEIEVLPVLEELDFLNLPIQFLNNHESYKNIRNKINNNFAYLKQFILQQLS
jgi:hypothetical protein